MLRVALLFVVGLTVAAGGAAFAQNAVSPAPAAALAVSPDAMAQIVAHMIADAIPREYELNGPKLAAKLNHSIEKRKERLVFTPEMLLRASRGADHSVVPATAN